MENISFSVFLNLLNFMTLRNGKVQDKKFKVFKTHLSLYQNILQKMGGRNSSQMIINLKNAKTNIILAIEIQCFSRHSWHVLMTHIFFLKRNL